MSQGKELRDDGIEQVLAPEVLWSDRYRAVIVGLFASRPEGFRFTGETLRLVATESGIEAPHHHNSWGAIARSLITGWMRDRQIITMGYAPAKDPAAHARSYPQYEKITARRYRFADDARQISLLEESA
jgi:hypothetical protein